MIAIGGGNKKKVYWINTGHFMTKKCFGVWPLGHFNEMLYLNLFAELKEMIFLSILVPNLECSVQNKILHVFSGQEAHPVQGQDLVLLPENILDLVGRNQGE